MKEKARGRHSLWLRFFLFWACWNPEDIEVSGQGILSGDLYSGETRILDCVAEGNPKVNQYEAELECIEKVFQRSQAQGLMRREAQREDKTHPGMGVDFSRKSCA